MKTVKLRDFQRHLHRYIKEGGAYEVISQDGEVLGTFTVGKILSVGSHIIGDALVIVTPTLTNNICSKCNKDPASYTGESYNDNNEYVSMKICETCYRIFKPANFKRI